VKLKDLYTSIIAEGIRHDPRDRGAIKDYLNQMKKEFSCLAPSKRWLFDKEKLTNPFSDTRLLYGRPNAVVKNIMVGIDIGVGEIVLADSLRKRGKKTDLILSHHPEGLARSVFYEVMNVQYDILKKLGVTSKKAQRLLEERITEVMRKVISGNAMRSVDAARLIGLPFMCAHTPADNFAAEYLSNLISKARPKKVGDIIDILLGIPEYKHAVSVNARPRQILGKPSDRCGKVFVDMTGGTEGPKNIFPELKKVGVKTVVGMHMSEEHFKKAKKSSLDVVIAGHISSDNLGLNLLLDAIDKKGRLNITPCSGFVRIERR